MTRCCALDVKSAGFKIADLAIDHAIPTGVGVAKITNPALSFTPKGLQPADMIPVLKGFIADADGALAVQASYRWDKSGLSGSGATVRTDGLAFAGPSRAVNRTSGIAGGAKFKSLLPLATDGVQQLSIDYIDMDALKLEDGQVDFIVDADGSFQIEEAVWPWMGGTIGVYEALAPLDGSSVRAPLRADDLDLAELFDFLDIAGLSGQGRLEGSLPLLISQGVASVDKGVLRGVGPGVVRYESQSASAAADAAESAAGESAGLVFRALQNFEYERFEAEVDGRLDGDMVVRVGLDGANPVVLYGAPFKINMNIEAPLLALLSQARATTDIRRALQLDGAARDAEAEK